MRPTQLLVAAFAVSLSSAFSFESLNDNSAIAQLENALYRRQNNNDNNNNNGDNNNDGGDNNNNAEQTSKAPEETKAEETGKPEATTGESENTGKATNTKGPTRTVNGPSATGSDAPEYAPNLPAGGVQMITPSALAGNQYYKIGDWVTFAWNYTSLSQTPSAIDVIATCTKNQATYTLAVNQSVEETGMVLWDTGAYQATATVPLLTETYTLIIYDADSSISAVPRPGYLGAQGGAVFGMYQKQDYKDLDKGFRCPTCNSGSILSAAEKQTLGFILSMATVTVVSFTWFGSGFGIF